MNTAMKTVDNSLNLQKALMGGDSGEIYSAALFHLHVMTVVAGIVSLELTSNEDRKPGLHEYVADDYCQCVGKEKRSPSRKDRKSKDVLSESWEVQSRKLCGLLSRLATGVNITPLASPSFRTGQIFCAVPAAASK